MSKLSEILLTAFFSGIVAVITVGAAYLYGKRQSDRNWNREIAQREREQKEQIAVDAAIKIVEKLEKVIQYEPIFSLSKTVKVSDYYVLRDNTLSAMAFFSAKTPDYKELSELNQLLFERNYGSRMVDEERLYYFTYSDEERGKFASIFETLRARRDKFNELLYS